MNIVEEDLSDKRNSEEVTRYMLASRIEEESNPSVNDSNLIDASDNTDSDETDTESFHRSSNYVVLHCLYLNAFKSQNV